MRSIPCRAAATSSRSPTSPRRRPRRAAAGKGRSWWSSARELRLALVEEGDDALGVVGGAPGLALQVALEVELGVEAVGRRRLDRPLGQAEPARRAGGEPRGDRRAPRRAAPRRRPPSRSAPRPPPSRRRAARRAAPAPWPAARRGCARSDQLPPASGTRPILEKAWMKRAERAASTMSQAKAMLAPAPAATPLTAQTTGFSSARIRRSVGIVEGLERRRRGPARRRPCADRGRRGPARPRSRARRRSAAPRARRCRRRARSKPARSARCIASLKAFSLSGRFRVSVSTPASSAVSTVSDCVIRSSRPLRRSAAVEKSCCINRPVSQL